MIRTILGLILLLPVLALLHPLKILLFNLSLEYPMWHWWALGTLGTLWILIEIFFGGVDKDDNEE